MSQFRDPSRRRFLQGASAAGAISVAEWLGFFRKNGVPGSAKDWGIAAARAQEQSNADDNYLVYWYLEGGWDSYSLFSPVATPNHSALNIAENELNPNPRWSDQRYRSGIYVDPTTQQNILHGHLAVEARDLFSDMCILSSSHGDTFHSGGRWKLHYGEYADYANYGAQRDSDERTVMQAFAEAKGASYLLPSVGWHRWLADGELDLGQYPEGTGYYDKLGPAHAHTIFGKTPRELKQRIINSTDTVRIARRNLLRTYTDDIHRNFVSGKDGQSVRSFQSALEQYQREANGDGPQFDINTLFEDAELKAHFGVQPGDENRTSASINGMPERSKETPHIRTQAMMAYELMRARMSCALYLESREIRGFDSHYERRYVLGNDGNSDQTEVLRENLWNPLRAFVSKLKSTEAAGLPGTSMWDRTTIVICSEMGRTIQGDVESILNGAREPGESDAAYTARRYQAIQLQDVCQHWHVNSVVFMGGTVNGGRQFGKVGTQSLDAIPLLADGSLDPAYNPTTGVQNQNPTGTVPDHGSTYATALYCAGVDPTDKGRNVRPPLRFIKRG
jgi:hypothetical protein